MSDTELFESFLPEDAMTLEEWKAQCYDEEDWILDCEQGFND